jgi:hypothetical protein
MPRTLTDDDIIAVLEEIIREGGSAQARIAAVRALREMTSTAEAPAGFEDLDDAGSSVPRSIRPRYCQQRRRSAIRCH